MKVIVDTSVWSLALRRNEAGDVAHKLTRLIMDSMVVMIGPVRQELLSGISDESVFNRLKTKLEQFDDLPIITRDYEMAANFYNICRKKGVQGSHVDFLICAVASNNDLLIFSTDQDFIRYASYLPIRLLNWSIGS